MKDEAVFIDAMCLLLSDLEAKDAHLEGLANAGEDPKLAHVGTSLARGGRGVVLHRTPDLHNAKAPVLVTGSFLAATEQEQGPGPSGGGGGGRRAELGAALFGGLGSGRRTARERPVRAETALMLAARAGQCALASAFGGLGARFEDGRPRFGDLRRLLFDISRVPLEATDETAMAELCRSVLDLLDTAVTANPRAQRMDSSSFSSSA